MSASTDADTALMLTEADALAAQVVTLAAPVRFCVAQSEAERDAAYRLRYLTVVEEGWAEAHAFADGRERDDYDDAAVHVLGWDGATLAAEARLVFPAPQRRLPIEAEFDIAVEPRGRVVDLGRGIVARPYRHAGHSMFLGLLACCWLETRSRNLCHLCGAVNDSMLALYDSLGFRLETLGPPRRYYGQMRYPIKLDALASLCAVARHLAGKSPRNASSTQ